MPQNLLRSQLVSWSEAETTQIVRRVVEQELDRVYKLRSTSYVKGNPHATQEKIATFLGAEVVLHDMMDLLNADNEGGTLDAYFHEETVVLVGEEDEE